MSLFRISIAALLATLVMVGCAPQKRTVRSSSDASAIATFADGTAGETQVDSKSGEESTDVDLVTPKDDAEVETANANLVGPDVVAADATETIKGQEDLNACIADSQCEAKLTPGTCQLAVCEKGLCVLKNKPKGDKCDDGNGCTTGEVCDGEGACVDGGNPCVEADNPCRGPQALCVPGAGGTFTCDYSAYENASCKDGDGCTQNDICNKNGICRAGKQAPICADATSTCKTNGVCVNDGNETFHCDYSGDDGTRCDDGKICTASSCATGQCVTNGDALFGTRCKPQSSEIGICGLKRSCLALTKWKNVKPGTDTTQLNRRFETLLRTRDGSTWLAVTTTYAYSSQACAWDPTTGTEFCSEGETVYYGGFAIHRVNGNGTLSLAAETPMADWVRFDPNAKIDVACRGDVCTILDGPVNWDADSSSVIALLFNVRYDGTNWVRFWQLETKLRETLANAASDTQYYRMERLLSTSFGYAAGQQRLSFAGRIVIGNKKPADALCNGVCNTTAQNHFVHCTFADVETDPQVTCSVDSPFGNAYSLNGTDGFADFVTKRVIDLGDGSRFALNGVVRDPGNNFNVDGGQWRFSHRDLQGAWSLQSSGCDGLAFDAKCFHDTGFERFGGPLPTDHAGLQDLDGISGQLFAVGDPLASELTAENTTPKVAGGRLYHLRNGSWTLKTIPSEVLLGDDLTSLPKTTVATLHAVRLADAQSVLLQGLRSTCESSALECGKSILRTNQPFVMAYRPGSGTFEPMIPIGTPYSCCDNCGGGVPRCNAPDAQRWRVGPRSMLLGPALTRVHFLGHDDYRISDPDNPATYVPRSSIWSFVTEQ